MRKTNCNLTRERLQEVLDYDPDTGIFKCKVSRSRRVKPGDVAGCVNGHGYWRITVDYTSYWAHRLAWLYVTGVWPTLNIDHINGIRSDNRFGNLREATTTQNHQNSRFSCGRSKYRGVSWHKKANKWQTQIKINGKSHYLGLFDTEKDAAESYQSARRRLHPFAPGSDTIGHAGQE